MVKLPEKCKMKVCVVSFAVIITVVQLFNAVSNEGEFNKFLDIVDAYIERVVDPTLGKLKGKLGSQRLEESCLAEWSEIGKEFQGRHVFAVQRAAYQVFKRSAENHVHEIDVRIGGKIIGTELKKKFHLQIETFFCKFLTFRPFIDFENTLRGEELSQEEIEAKQKELSQVLQNFNSECKKDEKQKEAREAEAESKIKKNKIDEKQLFDDFVKNIEEYQLKTKEKILQKDDLQKFGPYFEKLCAAEWKESKKTLNNMEDQAAVRKALIDVLCKCIIELFPIMAANNNLSDKAAEEEIVKFITEHKIIVPKFSTKEEKWTYWSGFLNFFKNFLPTFGRK